MRSQIQISIDNHVPSKTIYCAGDLVTGTVTCQGLPTAEVELEIELCGHIFASNPSLFHHPKYSTVSQCILSRKITLLDRDGIIDNAQTSWPFTIPFPQDKKHSDPVLGGEIRRLGTVSYLPPSLHVKGERNLLRGKNAAVAKIKYELIVALHDSRTSTKKAIELLFRRREDCDRAIHGGQERIVSKTFQTKTIIPKSPYIPQSWPRFKRERKGGSPIDYKINLHVPSVMRLDQTTHVELSVEFINPKCLRHLPELQLCMLAHRIYSKTTVLSKGGVIGTVKRKLLSRKHYPTHEQLWLDAPERLDRIEIKETEAPASFQSALLNTTYYSETDVLLDWTGKGFRRTVPLVILPVRSLHKPRGPDSIHVSMELTSIRDETN
jgi:hypothetical protein